jgi:hypothetical protein
MPRSKIRPLLRSRLGQALACRPLLGVSVAEAPPIPTPLPGSSELAAAASAPGRGRAASEARTRPSHFPLMDGASSAYRHTSFTEED